MSNRCFNVLFAAVSLLLGALCYVLFREGTYLAIWAGKMVDLRLVQDYFAGDQWNLCRYYLPDFFWSVSLSCAMVALWGSGRWSIFCLAGLFLGGMWELLQGVGIVNGTADWLDVLMYLLGSVFCITINKRREMK